jgi:leader peptidase (prepilin peptidase)/N-methyltransferase
LVEVITPILFIGLYLQYQYSGILFFKYAILFSFLIPIFFIDAFHNIIPHVLSIPLIVIGLLISILPGNDIGIINAAATALFVFCFLLLLAWGYQKARGMEGLGGGDIWLLTGIATFFGLQGIPFIFIMAAFMGIIYFIIFVRLKDKPFAFGTFIAIAAILWVLIGGDTILDLIPYI